MVGILNFIKVKNILKRMITLIKEKFISKLIKELNDENERTAHDNKKTLDVCFMVSIVDQKIEECKEFMEDITKYKYCINGFDKDTTGGYTNGKIRILIEKPEKENEMMYAAYYDYCYYLEFTYDERYWGYCMCDPQDEGYIEKHQCTGNGCDWVAPSFHIEKSISLGGGRWEGTEKDYWAYEEKFNLVEENKNKEVEKHRKEQEKQRLIDSIEAAKIKLALL